MAAVQNLYCEIFQVFRLQKEGYVYVENLALYKYSKKLSSKESGLQNFTKGYLNNYNFRFYFSRIYLHFNNDVCIYDAPCLWLFLSLENYVDITENFSQLPFSYMR